ncbi:hypothetical protein FACS189452_03760 [Bacteroidia bacterium]|nr:hypothetical protein FACS189452_03760 [Bacteroidia bacterium]
MNTKVFKLISGMQLLLATAAWSQEQTAVLDNGVIRREIDFSENHISGKSYSMGQTQFIADKSPEFALSVNDVLYSGNSEWKNIQRRDTVGINGDKGLILSFEKDKSFTVELFYMVYPNLPVVHKALRVINIGHSDLKVEAVDVENLRLNWSDTHSWIMRQYARQKWLGPYIGNCNDPLIIVHDTWLDRGIAIGNEAIGVTKRTSVYVDGRSVSAGLTHPEEEFGFRKWLRPDEQWFSPWVFTALYNNTPDPSVVLSTVVSDFVRKHVGVRIEQLPKKPLFVYNTWMPFFQGVNEELVKEVAKAASECGVEEFIIDDGWELGTGCGGEVRAEEPENDQDDWLADWKVHTEKFPNGLSPVFDYIKSLGMKPGLWLSVAIADPTNRTYFKEHPEWFIVGKDGQLSNLHVAEGQNKTACMGTEDVQAALPYLTAGKGWWKSENEARDLTTYKKYTLVSNNGIPTVIWERPDLDDTYKYGSDWYLAGGSTSTSEDQEGTEFYYKVEGNQLFELFNNMGTYLPRQYTFSVLTADKMVYFEADNTLHSFTKQ